MKKGVLSAVSMLTGVVAGAGIAGKVQGVKLKKAEDMSGKHLKLFLMMNQWIKAKQEGKKLSTYFDNNGYKRIAIYGMSYVGETLMCELKDTGIEVAYGIDQNADSIFVDIDVVTMEDTLDEVDVVVVTAITFFEEIEDKLKGKLNCTIISLEDILYEV